MKKYKNRNEVPSEYKWDLTEYCKDDKEFNELYAQAKKMVDELPNYVGCTKSKDKLYEYIKSSVATNSLIDRLYVYALMLNDQELGVSSSQEKVSKIEDLYNSYSINTNFFEPELLKLDKESYNSLFNKKELDEYKSLLDKIYRNKDHIISEEKENIVSSLVNAMGNFEIMSSTMLNSEHDYGTITINGEEEKISSTNYRRLMKNPNREIRKEVRDKFCKTLDRYGATSAQLLNGYVKGNIETAKIHNYDNAWERKIFELNMPSEAYECLKNTTEEHLDSLQRYYRIFKKLTGIEDLHQYDLDLELTKNDKEYSIEEAQKLCLKAVEPLGAEYQKMFKKIFDDKHIDYAQYPGKCSGGYNIKDMEHNSRILMSYNYDLDSVSIIAHEGGHNVHNQMLMKYVPVHYNYVSTLCSEVTSLTNECLLSSYVAKNGESNDIKIAGIHNILRVIVTNLFGAIREGKMEQDFYNHVLLGNSITKDYMDNLTYKSLEKYYGNEVILDEHSKNSWINRSHYYNNFYMYDYAFSISVATYVASEILSGNKDILDRYMKYLSTGSDKWPVEAFAILGIDLTKKEVYEKAIKYFDSLLDELEKLCK